MKNELELILHADGITLCHPRDPAIQEFIGDQDSLGNRMTAFCQRHALLPGTVMLFLAEDIVFVKIFELPLGTPDLKEAISYQLGLLTPFSSEDMLHSFVANRRGRSHHITLMATPRPAVDALMREIIDAGFSISGLYPENQRYVNSSCRKMKWALLIPGLYPKVLIFDGIRITERFLCSGDIDFTRLASRCNTEIIYHLQPPLKSRFLHAGRLFEHKPLLHGFNLLPAAYRKPSYSSPVIISLLILNLLALLTLVGVKGYRFNVINNRLDTEIARVLPLVKQVNELHLQEKGLTSHIAEIKALGSNPDLIGFLNRLTQSLPANSYLDQFLMTSDSSAIAIQGYTDDISGMTARLQEIGETRLKSTSRRKDKTYFVVEINLP